MEVSLGNPSTYDGYNVQFFDNLRLRLDLSQSEKEKEAIHQNIDKLAMQVFGDLGKQFKVFDEFLGIEKRDRSFDFNRAYTSFLTLSKKLLNKTADWQKFNNILMLISQFPPRAVYAQSSTPQLSSSPNISQPARPRSNPAGQRVSAQNHSKAEVKSRVLKAAKEGDINMMYLVAVCFQSGEEGFELDLKQAKFWFKASAARGHQYACYGLAGLYLKRHNELIDTRKATQAETEIDRLDKKINKLRLELISVASQGAELGYCRCAFLLAQHYYGEFSAPRSLLEQPEKLKAKASRYFSFAIQQHERGLLPIDRLTDLQFKAAKEKLAELGLQTVNMDFPLLPTFHIKNKSQMAQEVELLRKKHQTLSHEVDELSMQKQTLEKSYVDMYELQMQMQIKEVKLSEREVSIEEHERTLEYETGLLKSNIQKLRERGEALKEKEKLLIAAERQLSVKLDAPPLASLELEKEKKEIEKERKRLIQASEGIKRSEKALNDMKAQLQHEKETFAEERSEVEKSVQEMRLKVERDLSDQWQQIEVERKALGNAIENLKTAKAKLNTRISDLEGSTQVEKTKREEVEAELLRLKQEKQALEKELEDLTKHGKMFELKDDRLRTMKNQLEKLQVENRQLENRAREVSNYEKQLKDAKARLNVAQEGVQHYKEFLAAVDKVNRQGLFAPLIVVGIKNQDLTLIKRLLAQQFDPNRKDEEGNSCLHLALLVKNRQILDLLLNVPKIDLNALNNHGKLPIELALDLFPDKRDLLVQMGSMNPILNLLEIQRDILGNAYYESVGRSLWNPASIARKEHDENYHIYAFEDKKISIDKMKLLRAGIAIQAACIKTYKRCNLAEKDKSELCTLARSLLVRHLKPAISQPKDRSWLELEHLNQALQSLEQEWRHSKIITSEQIWEEAVKRFKGFEDKLQREKANQECPPIYWLDMLNLVFEWRSDACSKGKGILNEDELKELSQMVNQFNDRMIRELGITPLFQNSTELNKIIKNFHDEYINEITNNPLNSQELKEEKLAQYKKLIEVRSTLLQSEIGRFKLTSSLDAELSKF